jgi:sucrose-phosphate synthase
VIKLAKRTKDIPGEEGDKPAGTNNLKVTLISLHGLIRAHDPQLGRDADPGGQVKYVLELAREFAEQPNVRAVELLTRQIVDPKVDDDYAQLEEPIAENAKIVRIPFGPRRYLSKESSNAAESRI